MSCNQIYSLIEKETEMFIERYIHLMLSHGFTIDVVNDKLHQMVVNEVLSGISTIGLLSSIRTTNRVNNES